MHPHDKKWIDEQIKALPFELRPIAMQGYKRVFKETYAASAGKISQENDARREANTRLRKFVEKNICK